MTLLSAFGCSPAVDLTAGLRLQSLTTGWYEVIAAEGQIKEGQIKLVPAISFKLKNVSARTLRTLQVNAIFKRVGEDTEWGSGFRTVVGSTGLSPADTSTDVFLKSELGYVGTESRFEMLRNSRFVDARVGIFAKYGSTSWASLGEYAIARHLIER